MTFPPRVARHNGPPPGQSPTVPGACGCFLDDVLHRTADTAKIASVCTQVMWLFPKLATRQATPWTLYNDAFVHFGDELQPVVYDLLRADPTALRQVYWLACRVGWERLAAPACHPEYTLFVYSRLAPDAPRLLACNPEYGPVAQNPDTEPLPLTESSEGGMEICSVVGAGCVNPPRMRAWRPR